MGVKVGESFARKIFKRVGKKRIGLDKWGIESVHENGYARKRGDGMVQRGL